MLACGIRTRNYCAPAIQVFLCADLWKEEKTLRAAYHDSLGVTEEFIKNGIQHALKSLGHGPAGDTSLWDYDVRQLLQP